jgi:hypothetical protein
VARGWLEACSLGFDVDDRRLSGLAD